MALNTVLDQPTMSNLTSLSEEASFSSGNGVSMLSAISHQQQSIKRKRKLPGNPDPNAEVIALSPRALMATNRFLCEICNKGFQRDQNLQLHRRAHNLPWKLKQRSSKEMKKRVFICPEPSCVHHDPSRALGDLTGIKKHFFRKHGEKKWKCEKCSKRYAVQTDWKAHSKTCGTREYRCDCGTLFSRKDSFITHRAFCDALAQETARLSSPSNPLLQNPNPFSFPPNPILQQTHFPNISQLSSSLSLSQNHYHSQETKPSIPLFLNPKPSISSYFSTQVPKSPFLSNFTNQAQPTTTPHISATASTDHVPQMCHQTHLEIDHQFAEVGHMVSAGISPEMESESSFPAMQELLNSRFGLFLNQREKNQHHQSTRDFLGIGDDPNMSMRELLSFSGVDLDYESNQRLKPAVISNFHCSTATETWGNC